MTNGDYIRSLDDEMLAHFILNACTNHKDCEHCLLAMHWEQTGWNKRGSGIRTGKVQFYPAEERYRCILDAFPDYKVVEWLKMECYESVDGFKPEERKTVPIEEYCELQKAYDTLRIQNQILMEVNNA